MAKLSIFNVVGHALSTVAISRVPVSTVHTIKALTPLFTVLSFRFLFNVHYSFMAYFSLVPLTLGVMMACTSLSFSANDLVGLSTALASTFIFVAQSIYSKNLVGRGTEEQKGSGLTSAREHGKLDKINIIYYTSACSTVMMIPMALYYDGPKILLSQRTAVAPQQTISYVFALITANGILQFFQNFLAFSVLALVSPVTYSIASLFKRVFVICFAIIWFGQSVSALQWLGIILTFAGLYIYNGAKSSKSIAKGEEKLAMDERRNSFSLPTNTRNTAWHPSDVVSQPQEQITPTSNQPFTGAPSTAVQTAYNLHQTEQNPTPTSTTHHHRSASILRSEPDNTSNAFRRSPASAHITLNRKVESGPSVSASHASQRPSGLEIGLPQSFVQDPRRSIPSPPPSRGPSSDDEFAHIEK
jgi:solute carrier family 35 protein E1